MSKAYMEVITSKYIKGTSMRDKSTEHVLLDFESAESFAETENCILEAIKKYSEEHDIMLGIEYNNAMVGTNMYNDQQYSTRVFIEDVDDLFRVAYIRYYPNLDDISLDFWVSREKYEKHNKSFRRVKREEGLSF